jgi:redox-sensitive bicupin YhaK (pirin superfamily)
MSTLRSARDRGQTRTSWLDSRHSFSFADYYDPQQMGFSVLRVINDDVIAPGSGFPTHGHRDMEIVSYVVEGGLAHRDSLGNGSVIRAGELQRMRAGRGIRHSEFNASDSEPGRFLQIWIIPDRPGLEPGYEQRAFPIEERVNRWVDLVTPTGADGTLSVAQDVVISGTLLEPGQDLPVPVRPGRRGWLQVVQGQLQLGSRPLSEGDGVAFDGPGSERLLATTPSELLFFDLP